MVGTPFEELLLEGHRSGQIGGALETQGRHAKGFVAFEEPPIFGGSIVDLGSGVGLPALVLADAFPETRWTLIERRVGRADLLRRAVNRLGWSHRVEVLGLDAGEVAVDPLRGSADWVTARAFGPPAITAELAAPFLKPGGSLLTSEPEDSEVSQRWPDAGLARCGLEFVERWQTDDGVFVRFRRTRRVVDDLPRRGARKRPLF